MKTIEDIFNFFNWQKLKGLSFVFLWGVITYVHSTIYVPHLTEELKPKLIKAVQDSLKNIVLNELRHDGISLNLQLSEELGVPLYKVPHVIGQSIMVTDSAKTMQHFLPILEDIRRIVDVGLKYDKMTKRYFIVTPVGGVSEVHDDKVGLYRYTKNGEKKYLYIY